MFYVYGSLGGNPEYLVRMDTTNLIYPEHMHQEFELILIKEGQMDVTIGYKNVLLSKDDIALIYPNQIHSINSNNCKSVIFVFSPLFVQSYAGHIKDELPKNNVFRPDEYMISLLDKLESSSPVVYRKGVLYLLFALFEEQTEFYENQNIKNEKALVDMLLFVENSFSEKCSLKDISYATGYDYKYLSHMFKRVTGINFNEYVNNCRLGHAIYLMDNTDKTILQCAMDSGFGCIRSFNRCFKKTYGITPEQHRKDHGANTFIKS